MYRRATSPEEIAQIARVHALLCEIGVVPCAELVVMLASGAELSGLPVRIHLASKPGRKGKPRSYQGGLTLATMDGHVDVDYLDIVSICKNGSPVSQATTAC